MLESFINLQNNYTDEVKRLIERARWEIIVPFCERYEVSFYKNYEVWNFVKKCPVSGIGLPLQPCEIPEEIQTLLDFETGIGTIGMLMKEYNLL